MSVPAERSRWCRARYGGRFAGGGAAVGWATAGLLVGCLLLAPIPVASASVTQECGNGVTCVSAQGGAIDGVASQATGGSGGTVAGSVAGSAGGRGHGGPVVQVERRIAPVCSGNSPYQDALVCVGAVSICGSPGDVAYWVWTRPAGSSGPWRRTDVPPYVCYGPGSPVATPAASVAGMVQRDFRRYPLPRATVRSEPGGDTLVNLATNVYTGAPAATSFTLVLLGTPVQVQAHARQWVWHFGDGATLTTTSPGRPGSLDVAHTYARTGTMALSVDVVWSGTYRLPGAGADLPVRGTATTVGPPVPLSVRAARSHYQSG